jgi:hypothetical protein
MKSVLTVPSPPRRVTVAAGSARSRSTADTAWRSSISAASSTLVLAPNWLVGTSVRVAVTTISSRTGASGS